MRLIVDGGTQVGDVQSDLVAYEDLESTLCVLLAESRAEV